MNIHDRKPNTVYVVTYSPYAHSNWNFGQLFRTDESNNCIFIGGQSDGSFGFAEFVKIAYPSKLAKLFYL